MRICLVGEYSLYPDEGKQSVVFNLVRELSKRHRVITLNPKSAFSVDFWRQIKPFKPQIIHYLPGPTIKSFLLAKAIHIFYTDARVVMSALHPLFPSFLGRLLPLLKPDLILTQSDETERLFLRLGFKTAFLPNGVDVGRFVPVSEEVKLKLRGKYGIDENKFVVLHIGHITRVRNLEIFREIQKRDNNQVIIIGSPSVRMEKKVFIGLEREGCLVLRTRVKSIEELYGLSDCYVFPTLKKEGCIELPISIMEAMACNLPVVSTPFGALPGVFSEGDGLIFADNDADIIDRLEMIKDGGMEVKTRDKVMPYTWDRVAKSLEGIYSNLAS